MSTTSLSLSGVRLPLELGYETCSLEAAERAARVILRDSREVAAAIEVRLAALREYEERTRALMTVAPFPYSFE